MFAAVLGYLLHQVFNSHQIDQWGWRIPFFIGCMIIPFIFAIRRSLQETDAFLAHKHHPSFAEILRSIVQNWQLIAGGMLLVVMTTVAFT
jgi:MHS family citrate/tricarballylate:H+ symporter-like MFS transporter